MSLTTQPKVLPKVIPKPPRLVTKAPTKFLAKPCKIVPKQTKPVQKSDLALPEPPKSKFAPRFLVKPESANALFEKNNSLNESHVSAIESQPNIESSMRPSESSITLADPASLLQESQITIPESPDQIAELNVSQQIPILVQDSTEQPSNFFWKLIRGITNAFIFFWSALTNFKLFRLDLETNKSFLKNPQSMSKPTGVLSNLSQNLVELPTKLSSEPLRLS